MQYMCCKSYVGSYKQMLHVDWLSGDASEWNTRQFAQICDLMDVTRHIPSNGLPTGAHFLALFPPSIIPQNGLETEELSFIQIDNVISGLLSKVLRF